MGRVEKFKEARMTKVKFLASITIFLTILFGGVIMVDYSLNNIIFGSKSIHVLKIEKVSENIYEIDFANRRYNLNTTYIDRDIKRLKNKLSKIF